MHASSERRTIPPSGSPGREAYAGARVVVLGASGFIGRWVARALHARGAHLYLFARDRANAEAVLSPLGVRGELVNLDFRDFAAVEAALRAIAPSVTFNLAGYGVDHRETDEAAAYRLNADFVRAISSALVPTPDPGWLGQSLVQVGSGFEYGHNDGDLHEDATANPTSVYAKSKLAGTEAVVECSRAHGLKAVVARAFTVYGAGEYPGRLMPSLLRTARTGDVLPLSTGGQLRDFTYVEDVVEALLRLGVAEAAPGEIVNVATGRLTSVRAFIETAADVLHIARDRLQFGAIATRIEEVQHTAVPTQRLRQLVGWAPGTSLREGIRKTQEIESGIVFCAAAG